ncbi:MAG: sugar transferase [Pirellulales bacterium]|nr:sugar transferase [Pirellulales bacterium]
MSFAVDRVEVISNSGVRAVRHECVVPGAGLPEAVTVRAEEMRPYFRLKYAAGRVMAALLLVPALPLIGVLVLLVRATSRGPGIYRQVRVGAGGRSYVMYKIRTMRHDAEASSGPVWAAPNDARMTRLGHFLRKVHLDEFPQLFNVVKGEMALIGPRPERPEFTEILTQQLPGYLDRLQVKPGITGLAQINLPPDTDLDSVRRKLVLDLEYIRQAGVTLDLRILACTSLRLVGCSGQLASRLTRLDRYMIYVGRLFRDQEAAARLRAKTAQQSAERASQATRI